MPPIFAALAFALTVPATQPIHHAEVPAPARSAVAPSPPIDRGAFHDAMRKLWEDHVTWTRLYIVSAAAGLPDAQPAAERLLRNQADIGDAIKPFYGEAAGERLTALLRSHILIAADLVKAAKAGDTAAVEAASARWNTNADEIADFLSGANPDNWPRQTLRSEMRHHLDLTLREAQARLRGDWAADIAAYDTVHQHILGMADVLSAGIVKQQPRRFK
jgi:hypothetical protein